MKCHHYEIRVEGHLRSDWSEWFDGMTIGQEPSGKDRPACTVLSGSLDQAALHGVLTRISALGLILIGVQRVAEVAQAD